VQLRWSVFNVLNDARFDAYTSQDQVQTSNTFGDYSATLTQPRVMEFALIYRF
jgi:hypothetical protein